MSFPCPVCGFPDLPSEARDSDGGGSDEICPCCGFQFGWTDDDLGFTDDQWRERWKADGMPWCSAGQPAPDGWDPVAQLATLPD
jgi:hypothetical protein